MTVALNIRRERKAAHLTQEMLAIKAGISPQYLSRVEHMSNSVTVDRLARIADSLGIEPCELLVEPKVNPTTYEYIDFVEMLEEAPTDKHKGKKGTSSQP